MKYVRLIDDKGLFIEDTFVEELTEFTIETPCTEGFYKPKWNGTKWIEGLTQIEIDAIKNVTTPKTEMEELKDQILATQMLILENEAMV